MTTPRRSEALYDSQLPLRSPAQVMDLARLGSMHQCRLSFMRKLVRKLMAEAWQIKPSLIDLDEHGYGTMVYSIEANGNRYSYVLFSDYLDDQHRDDRVIAEKWDVTMTLCIGDVSEVQLKDMRLNVPKQEGGRAQSNMLVLSRGNKSSRNFNYVVDQLATGCQPCMHKLAQVGYLYRTTAVYGSGKFGMANWQKVNNDCPEFASPFAAEMFNCFMLRHFSIEQAEHLARIKAPELAVTLDDDVKRFIGIGNSTGLGMAPYLIRHPLIISQWVLTREKAIARVVHLAEVSKRKLLELDSVFCKAVLHVQQTDGPDARQISRNKCLISELQGLRRWLSSSEVSYPQNHSSYATLIGYVEATMSLETQEMVNSCLMEVYPELVDDFEQYAYVDEHYQAQPTMSLQALQALIENQYDWALSIDFDQPEANHYFWYRSEEKMEPRIGDRFNEPGQDKEMPLTIARLVRQCYDCLLNDIAEHDHPSGKKSVAYFLLRHPKHSGIVRRIQTMAQECYGEIRANLADIDMLPMDLLRCKLSFFGVSKFDPKSKLWVRNTMFQGAPSVTDIGKPFKDEWYFPVASELSDVDS
ncbi:MAG: hypothetical protein ACI9LY_003043 [Arenicella sp.]|jgi:hypothetical protein